MVYADSPLFLFFFLPWRSLEVLRVSTDNNICDTDVANILFMLICFEPPMQLIVGAEMDQRICLMMIFYFKGFPNRE